MQKLVLIKKRLFYFNYYRSYYVKFAFVIVRLGSVFGFPQMTFLLHKFALPWHVPGLQSQRLNFRLRPFQIFRLRFPTPTPTPQQNVNEVWLSTTLQHPAINGNRGTGQE